MVVPTAIPPTTWQLGPKKKTCLEIASPAPFPYPNYVQVAGYGDGTVSVVRLSDGQQVQVLAPRCPKLSSGRVLWRSPNGHMFAVYEPRFTPAEDWKVTDLNTGMSFLGTDAVVSPDGTRIATNIYGQHGWTIIRQYDTATGRVLASLDVVSTLLGFAWTADSGSLVVSLPYRPKGAGLYVIPRDADAQSLPAGPEAGEPAPYAYWAPAVLANGHVVVAEAVYPPGRGIESWSIVDIDLQHHSARTILGDPDVENGLPSCSNVPVGTVLPAQAGQCRLDIAPGISTHGDTALLSGGDLGVWVYDGSSLRHVNNVAGNNANW
jgi:hypothetical protein